MIFHQKVNSIGNDIYSGFLYYTHGWPIHIHKSLEFVYVLRGTLHTTIGQNHYDLIPGDAVFVMSFQPHAYVPEHDTVYFITCFSPSHIPYFVSEFIDHEPDSSRITLSQSTVQYLLQIHNISESTYQDRTHSYRCATPSIYKRKAALYMVCAEIIEQSTWHEKGSDSDLILQMLSYIEKNHTENITLADMAQALSYEYHYLSRIFHNTFGINFKALINQYRCEKAYQLLTETKENISDIALSCGFQSIRSFNRIFLEYADCTPSELRSAK